MGEAVKPTIYLSNWSSHATPGHHGPGCKLTITDRICQPDRSKRPRVLDLQPTADDFLLYRTWKITTAEYRHRFESALSANLGRLAPGALASSSPEQLVLAGDTLCCTCSRAGAVWCHRTWAAPFLIRAGWRVILDGVEASDG